MVQNVIRRTVVLVDDDGAPAFDSRGSNAGPTLILLRSAFIFRLDMVVSPSPPFISFSLYACKRVRYPPRLTYFRERLGEGVRGCIGKGRKGRSRIFRLL